MMEGPLLYIIYLNRIHQVAELCDCNFGANSSAPEVDNADDRRSLQMKYE